MGLFVVEPCKTCGTSVDKSTEIQVFRHHVKVVGVFNADDLLTDTGKVDIPVTVDDHAGYSTAGEYYRFRFQLPPTVAEIDISISTPCSLHMGNLLTLDTVSRSSPRDFILGKKFVEDEAKRLGYKSE